MMIEVTYMPPMMMAMRDALTRAFALVKDDAMIDLLNKLR